MLPITNSHILNAHSFFSNKATCLKWGRYTRDRALCKIGVSRAVSPVLYIVGTIHLLWRTQLLQLTDLYWTSRFPWPPSHSGPDLCLRHHCHHSPRRSTGTRGLSGNRISSPKNRGSERPKIITPRESKLKKDENSGGDDDGRSLFLFSHRLHAVLGDVYNMLH